MPLRNTANRYGFLSKFFHWTIVALIVVQYILASIAEDLPVGMKKFEMYTYHKSVGITILILAVLRLSWRWMNPVPRLPDTIGAVQKGLAKASHVLLYLLIFVMPISGWIMSNAENFPVSYFGWFTLPTLVAPDRQFGHLMEEVHEWLFTTLLAVAVLHIAAALKHHFWNKDDVLKRMLPFSRNPPP
jgi:cytochrome b561